MVVSWLWPLNAQGKLHSQRHWSEEKQCNGLEGCSALSLLRVVPLMFQLCLRERLRIFEERKENPDKLLHKKFEIHKVAIAFRHQTRSFIVSFKNQMIPEDFDSTDDRVHSRKESVIQAVQRFGSQIAGTWHQATAGIRGG